MPRPRPRAESRRAARGPSSRLLRLRRRAGRSSDETGPTAGAPSGSVQDGARGIEPAGAGLRPAEGEGAPQDSHPLAVGTRDPHIRGRFLRALTHPGRGQLIAAAMLFLVGMAGVMQVRVNTAEAAYTTARREDLIVLLDGLGAESRRLEAELSTLDRTKTSLQSGADTQRVAREEAQKRVDELSILAGTAAATGPGISMRIADPNHLVTSDVILGAVEEMRDAGAEVIEINNTVRVVASTWFGMNARRIVVDGVVVSDPITIEVIGDPHSLEEAARFRGGIVSEITGPKIGGQVQIEQLNRVVVESLHTAAPNQYAQPASPSPTPR